MELIILDIFSILIGVILSALIVIVPPYIGSKIRTRSIVKDIVNKYAFDVCKKISVGFGRYIVIFDYTNNKFALVEEYGYKATVCHFKDIVDVEEITRSINPLYFVEYTLKIKTFKEDISINFINSKTKIFSWKDDRAKNKCKEIRRELAQVRAWQIKNNVA